ncbi:NUDIX domain-containing protein [Pontibacillus sp. HMF3514]|uniref:NUDIX domain-containing protein n=1 Tax=Pontibacillus sp. HMF3514 TaxID=2692425 RepID=UPI00131F9229|nr:NUDIX domain-containing protein [Pontibacillus sp. HMF3514]QHE51909.1 NUDIX domain-containing protein [Pontibacillus sp. HMF3514]
MIGSPNKFGYQIEQFYNSRNYSIDDFILSGSFVIARKDGRTLLCHNHKREQWELPAGKREPGETPWECAERELKEETGQVVSGLSWIGVMKLVNKENGKEKYNPVFTGVVEKLQPFHENEETDAIVFWDGEERIGEVDEVDVALLHKIF